MTALACGSCARPFGSAVAFCPFCGAAQRAAVRPDVAEPVMVAEPAPAAPVRPSPWRIPEPPVVRAPVVPPVSAVVPQRGRWRVRLGLVAAALGGAVVLFAVLVPPDGTLVVQVRGPGGVAVAGRVLVDGRDAGAAGERLRVMAGGHEVGLADAGFRAEPRRVEVARGGVVTVELLAREAPGRLTVSSSPAGASLRVMGRSWGPTPTTLELTPGGYEIGVSLSGYVSKTVSVRLERGESRTLAVELAPIGPPAPRFGAAPFERGIVVAGGGLLAGPSAGAEVVDALPPFAPVQVLGQVVTDETWLQVRAGSRQGFIRAGVVEAWDGWAQRNSVSGPMEGMTPTMRLVVAGRPFTLFGVQAAEGVFSRAGLARIQASLDAALRGRGARCVPVEPQRFQCKTVEGRDIAEMYVLNGAAVPGDGALPFYLEAQRAAREQQRGIWSPE